MDVKLVGAGFFGALIGWWCITSIATVPSGCRWETSSRSSGSSAAARFLPCFRPAATSLGRTGSASQWVSFAYFLWLLVLVAASDNFTVDFFLDGRRKKPIDPWVLPAGPGSDSAAAMGDGAYRGAQVVINNPPGSRVEVRPGEDPTAGR